MFCFGGKKERVKRREEAEKGWRWCYVLPLASHQQRTPVGNLRFVVLPSSVNILPEDPPWTGFWADSGQVSKEHTFGDLDQNK